MKKIVLTGIALILGIGTLPVVVSAQSPPDETVVQLRQSAEETTAEAEITATEDNTGEAREGRLQNYKERLEERITNAEARRLQAACKGAQVVVNQLNDNVSRVKQNREQAYASVSQKLTNLVAKLEAAGLEASTLSGAVASMESEVQIFMATLTDYQTILTDLAEMDCESDPEAFKAALQVAKQQRVTLISSSQGLRQYFNDSIKPVLQQLRQQLIADEEGDS